MLSSSAPPPGPGSMARASQPRAALAATPRAGEPRPDVRTLSQGEVTAMAPVLRAVVRLRTWEARPPHALQVRNERGFVVDGQGYVVTGDRAVSGARHIEVVLHDGRTFQASLVARDPLSDVAILRIPATGLPTIVLGDSGDLVVGEQVLVTGGTPGTDRGIAAATVRATGKATGGDLMVDLPPGPEALGAPLLNRRGQAVGVLTSAARSGGAARSMTFAVPIDRVKAVLRSLPTAGSSVSDR